MGSLDVIHGFPQLELLGFPHGNAWCYWWVIGTHGSEGWESATEQAAEAFVSILPGRFSAQKGPHMKRTVPWDAASPSNCVANLVIFGMFLKTWLLEAGD